MSKHWQPEGKIVRLRPRVRRQWTQASAYGGASGATYGRLVAMALVGAAVVGVAVGAILAFADRAVPVATLPPEIVLPEVQADPADAEWERQAIDGEERPSTLRPGSGQASSGRTEGAGGGGVAFGFCHSGGGTNCVVDGDTFYIDGAKVRIAGIDAPETHPPRCAYEASVGREATEKLHDLLNSGAVTMTSIDRDRDTYGRLLRNVQVDGGDVGAAMISAGLAREYGRGRRGWCQ